MNRIKTNTIRLSMHQQTHQKLKKQTGIAKINQRNVPTASIWVHVDSTIALCHRKLV